MAAGGPSRPATYDTHDDVSLPYHFALTQPLSGYNSTNPHALLGMLMVQDYTDQMLEILRNKNPLVQYTVNFKFRHLADFPDLIGQLRDNSEYVLKAVLEPAIRIAQTTLMNDPTNMDRDDHPDWSIKRFVNARVQDLPDVEEFTLPNLRTIRKHHAGKFMQVAGVVVGVGQARMVPRKRAYTCAKCTFAFTVDVLIEHDNTVRLPSVCPNPALLAGKKAAKCTCTAFVEKDVTGGAGSGTIEYGVGNEARSSLLQTDYQEIRVMERLESIGDMMVTPTTLTMVLENDLKESVEVGNEVLVTGRLVHRLGSMKNGQRTVLEPVLLVNHVKNSTKAKIVIGSKRSMASLTTDFEDFWSYWKAIGKPIRGRDVLVRSMCPSLHGMYAVKLALLLTLIGGCEIDLSASVVEAGRAARAAAEDGERDSYAGPEGGASSAHNTNGASSAPSIRHVASTGASNNIRGVCHMLLVGDPGTGKSQLMRFVVDLMPRAIFTTGVGSTAAGLTCTAVRDGNGYSLEAGALVLAHRGVLCIDEFSTLKSMDRGAVLEAMEHGSISIAKGGVTATLPTRCTLLGACNPKATGVNKSRYNWNAPDVPALTGLDAPVISRFDLVMLLPDPHTQEWDLAMSGFILSREVEAGLEILQDEVDEAQEEIRGLRSARMRLANAQVYGLNQAGAGLGSTQQALESSETPSEAQLAAMDAQIDEQEADLEMARHKLDVATNDLRALNKASGLDGTRYVVVTLDGMKDEDGSTVDGPCIAAVRQTGVVGHEQETVDALIQSLADGTAELIGNRFVTGRRVEDLLVSRLVVDTEQSLGPGYGGGYGGYAPPPRMRPPKHTTSGLDVRWDILRLQAYIAHVKTAFPSVSLSQEAGDLIKRYYIHLKTNEGRDRSRTTARMAESLQRLTQAHSRLMYRGEATVQDAAVAIGIMEYSASASVAETGGFGDSLSAGQTSFPGDPDADVQYRVERIVKRLMPWHGAGGGIEDAQLVLNKVLAQLKSERDDALARGGRNGATGSSSGSNGLQAKPGQGPLPMQSQSGQSQLPSSNHSVVYDGSYIAPHTPLPVAIPQPAPVPMHAQAWGGIPGAARGGDAAALQGGLAVPGRNAFHAATLSFAQARGRIDEDSPPTQSGPFQSLSQSVSQQPFGTYPQSQPQPVSVLARAGAGVGIGSSHGQSKRGPLEMSLHGSLASVENPYRGGTHTDKAVKLGSGDVKSGQAVGPVGTPTGTGTAPLSQMSSIGAPPSSIPSISSGGWWHSSGPELRGATGLAPRGPVSLAYASASPYGGPTPFLLMRIAAGNGPGSMPPPPPSSFAMRPPQPGLSTSTQMGVGLGLETPLAMTSDDDELL